MSPPPASLGVAGLAGAAYAAAALAAGFLLGTARVLAIAPRIGELAATILEVPVMLAVSWLACRSIVAAFKVPTVPTARLAMGVVAFAGLMAAELALAVWGFARPPADYLASFATPAGAVGLVAQVAFATLPWIQAALRRRPDAAG